MSHALFLACCIAGSAVITSCDQGGQGQGGSTSGEPLSSSGQDVAAVPQDDDRIDVGRKLLKEGRVDEATMVFDAVLNTNPDLARAQFYKGLANHERKAHGTALGWYESAESSPQDFPERRLLPYYMAWSYYYAGKPEEAKLRIDAFLDTTDSRRDAHFLAGLIAFNDDQLGSARTSFERAIELAQGSPEQERSMARAWIRLSDVLMRQSELDEALVAADKATELKPSMSEAWFRKYTILMRLGRDEESEFARTRWKELRSLSSYDAEGDS